MLKIKYYLKGYYGRNQGRISSFHRERGRKKQFRLIDHKRFFFCVPGKVLRFEKDSYRTGLVGLVYYVNGYFSYVLCPEKKLLGSFISGFTSNDTLSDGDFGNLEFVAPGSQVYNVELYPGSGGKLSRSAGTFCKVLKQYSVYTLIKLSSGETRLLSNKCLCSLGRVGNVSHKDRILGKAGISRHLGRRPIVRGRAMNPVDHPHGGRTNGGIFPRTPWGRLALGVKTGSCVKGKVKLRRNVI